MLTEIEDECDIKDYHPGDRQNKGEIRSVASSNLSFWSISRRKNDHLGKKHVFESHSVRMQCFSKQRALNAFKNVDEMSLTRENAMVCKSLGLLCKNWLRTTGEVLLFKQFISRSAKQWDKGRQRLQTAVCLQLLNSWLGSRQRWSNLRTFPVHCVGWRLSRERWSVQSKSWTHSVCSVHQVWGCPYLHSIISIRCPSSLTQHLSCPQEDFWPLP